MRDLFPVLLSVFDSEAVRVPLSSSPIDLSGLLFIREIGDVTGW